MLFLHGGQVHGFFDDIVVVEHFVLVDRLLKGPGVGVVLQIVEEVEEGVVVWAVTGRARELVHDGRPAAVLDGGNGQGVDGLHLALGPLRRRRVDLVALAYGADLRVGAFLLLEEHATALEVTYLRHHGTLHNGTALVVLDIAHPTRLFERDFLGEALLLEVADGVVVRVGEKVHDLRSGLDVVFEV